MRNIIVMLGTFALALVLCAASLPVLTFADEDTDGNTETTTAVTEQQADIPPAPAIATPSQNGFTIERSHLSAQIQTDASMRVSVQNTLQLGQNCNIFFWEISSLNGHSITNINSVRMASINENGEMEGDWISLSGRFFDADLRDALATLSSTNASLTSETATVLATDKTWMFDSYENRLYAFFPPHTNSLNPADGTPAPTPTVVIDIDYTVKDAVMAYDDVGEMYWYYISGGNNMPIWNLSAVIQLPVPRGETVEPGETVVAWGHGAPGTVDVQPDGTIRYEAPYVSQNQYMMAHVIFPVAWLENMSRETRQLHSGIRKASAIEGEEDWTDTSTSKTANFFGVNATFVGACAIGIAIALLLYFKRGREYEPSEHELYEISAMSTEQLQAQLSESASPTVVARFLRHRNINDADFTESIIHLIHMGAITVSIDAAAENTPQTKTIAPVRSTAHYPHSEVAEKILQERHAPNQLEGIRLHISKGAKSKQLQPIERETLKILFDDIADGYPTLPLSEIQHFAETKPERFTKLIEEWQAKLDEEVTSAEVFDTFGAQLHQGINIAAALYAVLGLAIGIAFSGPLIIISGIVTAIILAIIAAKCAKRTEKGIQLALMHEALHQRETSTEEATPQGFPAEAFTRMLEDEIAKAYR